MRRNGTANVPTLNPGKGIYLRGRTYWLKFQRAGVRSYVSLETGDPVEAVSRAYEIREAPALAARSPLLATIDRYLAGKRRLNIYSRATERVTGAALREFAAAAGHARVDQVTGKDAQRHYERLQARVAETTAQIHVRALKAFFNWCANAKQRLCLRSPFAEVPLARIDAPARLRFATAQQRDKLITDAPDDDLRFILYAGFHAGLRKGEIIEARVGWFDLHKSRAVHVENTDTFRVKDREARFIPLTQPFRSFLCRYLRGKPRDAFALRPETAHGKGTYRYDFHRPYNDYVTRKHLRWVTAHVMRHTFASLLVQAGVSVFKVARWLGDGVEVVERHYAHLSPKDADIDRML